MLRVHQQLLELADVLVRVLEDGGAELRDVGPLGGVALDRCGDLLKRLFFALAPTVTRSLTIVSMFLLVGLRLRALLRLGVAALPLAIWLAHGKELVVVGRRTATQLPTRRLPACLRLLIRRLDSASLRHFVEWTVGYPGDEACLIHNAIHSSLTRARASPAPYKQKAMPHGDAPSWRPTVAAYCGGHTPRCPLEPRRLGSSTTHPVLFVRAHTPWTARSSDRTRAPARLESPLTWRPSSCRRSWRPPRGRRGGSAAPRRRAAPCRRRPPPWRPPRAPPGPRG